MDYYSEDAEELYRRYDIVCQIHPSSLIGIVGTFDLAKAGYYESLLYCKDINSVLAGACAGGHEELALEAAQMGASEFGRGLEIACEKGHKEIALLMIQKNAGMQNWALEGGLEKACISGNKELALLLIDEGADWEGGVISACSWGHKELVFAIGQKVGGDILCEYCGDPLDTH
jgi:hypothetical protein